MAALVAATILTGCTSPAEPGPSKSPHPTAASTGKPAPSATPKPAPVTTATAKPTPTATPDWRDGITQITVRPELLQLKDAAGTELGTISYDATADEFVTLFSDLLGAAPVVKDHPGGHEWMPWTSYSWDGFELDDDHESGEWQADMNVSVTFSDPELGPRKISVSTIQGFQPGGDLAWLARWMDEPYHPDSQFNQVQAEHGDPVGPKSDWNEYSNSNSVTGQNGYPDPSSVIFAPWNFGIGHV